MKKVPAVLLLFALMIVAVSASNNPPQTMGTDSTFPISIIANPTTGNIPLTVQFSVNSTTQIAAYSWDFNGDGIIDSNSASPSFTYTSSGNYLAKVNVTDSNGNIAVDTKAIVVKSSIGISISANPTSGAAPLAVQFNAIANGQEPFQYNWDFNDDNVIDETSQSPKLTLTTPGTYPIRLTVIDATGNSATKTINITVKLSTTNVDLVSYFPTSIDLGEQTITFIVKNTGNDVLSSIDGKIIGNGIQYVSSTKIDNLNPNDQDSLTVTSKFLLPGNITATVRIGERNIPVMFSINQGVQYNIADMQTQLRALKGLSQKYDADIVDKKAAGFIVDAASDDLKSTKSYIDKAEQYLLINDLKDVKINLDLAQSSFDDVKIALSSAKKKQYTLAEWLHENALTITAVLAAIGALWGISVKLFGHAKRFHEKITTTLTEKRHGGKKKKKSKSKKKESKTEPKEEPSKEE